MDWVVDFLLIIFLAHYYDAQHHKILSIHSSYATHSESDFDRSQNYEWKKYTVDRVSVKEVWPL